MSILIGMPIMLTLCEGLNVFFSVEMIKVVGYTFIILQCELNLMWFFFDH
jgi:hypothetical protein